MNSRLANTRGVRNHARQSGRAAFWILGVLFVLFFLMVGPGLGLLEPAIVLIFGWATFLQRTISTISWNWDLVGMSIVASIIILLLVQQLVGGLFDRAAAARNLSSRWSWRWTWSGFVGLLVLFLVGMAVGGIAHQVGWMMTTKEPMIESKRGKWRDYSNMKQLDLSVRMVLDDETGDIEKVRQKLRSDQNGYIHEPSSWPPMLQTYRVLLVTANGTGVVGRLIFPLNGQQREKVGGHFSFDSGESAVCPWPKMQEMINTNRANLLAL